MKMPKQSNVQRIAFSTNGCSSGTPMKKNKPEPKPLILF